MLKAEQNSFFTELLPARGKSRINVLNPRLGNSATKYSRFKILQHEQTS
jgi:hypothetical protein